MPPGVVSTWPSSSPASPCGRAGIQAGRTAGRRRFPVRYGGQSRSRGAACCRTTANTASSALPRLMEGFIVTITTLCIAYLYTSVSDAHCSQMRWPSRSMWLGHRPERVSRNRLESGRRSAACLRSLRTTGSEFGTCSKQHCCTPPSNEPLSSPTPAVKNRRFTIRWPRCSPGTTVPVTFSKHRPGA